MTHITSCYMPTYPEPSHPLGSFRFRLARLKQVINQKLRYKDLNESLPFTTAPALPVTKDTTSLVAIECQPPRAIRCLPWRHTFFSTPENSISKGPALETMHERLDDASAVDWTFASPTKSGGFTGGEFWVTDHAGIYLRAGSSRGRRSRSSVKDYER
jgi:hypothetical protein